MGTIAFFWGGRERWPEVTRKVKNCMFLFVSDTLGLEGIFSIVFDTFPYRTLLLRLSRTRWIWNVLFLYVLITCLHDIESEHEENIMFNLESVVLFML